MTELQQKLLNESRACGPVACYGASARTAGQLAKAGHGTTTSNPGKSYSGRRLSHDVPYGTYFVASEWIWSQERLSFVRK